MQDLLAQPTRRRIHEVVCRHPGASAREVQRLATLGWGETAYHLDQLTRGGVLRRERGGRRDYYFPAAMGWEDRRLFQALRSPAQRRILLILSERPDLTLAEVQRRSGLSLSTTSFHVRQLLDHAVLEGHRDGNVQRYRLVHRGRLAELVKGYQASFRDQLVDRFVAAWSGLLGG